MIRKEGDGYVVYSEDEKRLGGPYPTREKAQMRLHQIEYFSRNGKDHKGDDKPKK